MNDSSTGREAEPVGAGGDARTSWSLMRTGFGPLLIASVGLLTIVLAGSASPQFGVGYAAGKLVTSLAFGLPVFLLLKYATRAGRRLAGVESLNLVCLVVAAVWVLQLALPLVLPGAKPDKIAAEESPYAKFVQRPAAQSKCEPWEREWKNWKAAEPPDDGDLPPCKSTAAGAEAATDTARYRNPDGSTKWELFTPMDPASAAKAGPPQ